MDINLRVRLISSYPIWSSRINPPNDSSKNEVPKPAVPSRSTVSASCFFIASFNLGNNTFFLNSCPEKSPSMGQMEKSHMNLLSQSTMYR